MRCFVAVDLPDDVRAALAEAQARLRGAAPRADVRWTAAGAMHLTLEFLGEVSPETSQPVRAAVAAVAGGWAHLRLGCGGLGVFPGPSRPRVLWAGITGDLAGLGELAAGIERALEPLGFPPPRRPFRGHVTRVGGCARRAASRHCWGRSRAVATRPSAPGPPPRSCSTAATCRPGGRVTRRWPVSPWAPRLPECTWRKARGRLEP